LKAGPGVVGRKFYFANGSFRVCVRSDSTYTQTLSLLTNAKILILRHDQQSIGA
jgi:hypothetical protein